MNTTIINAIRNKTVLALTYDGLPRLVEPHTYGESAAGNELLRAFQTKGQHKSEEWHDWVLLTVSKITGLSATGSTFAGPREGYKKNDKAMGTVYAEL